MEKFLWNDHSGTVCRFVTDETEGFETLDFAKKRGFKAKAGEVFVLAAPGAETVILVSLGKKADLKTEAKEKAAVRLAFNKLAKKAKEVNEEALAVSLGDLEGLTAAKDALLAAALEGVIEADYKFSKKSKAEDEEKETETSWHFAGEGLDEASFAAVKTEVTNLMEGVFFARDLVNETANRMYPETLAEEVRTALAPLGVEVEVFEKEKIEALGMHAYLAVANGSDREPRFIIMRYKGDSENSFTTALVGKGLTYDSGGYCIKPPSGMLTMHCDMGGAGTVIGTMYALAKNKAKANVTAVVAACENLISGHAYKTGDIIDSLSGKTIEIINTDAEGRLTLADALYYTTSVLKPNRVIDLATLTGAAVVALSEELTAAVTNDEAFFAEFRAAAEAAGEKVWLLPNDEKLAEKNKETKVADLQNVTTGGAGTITAGQFVGEFLAEEMPWIHLDIAGTAFRGSAQGIWPERATGYHVKGLYQLLAK